jgi:uncharacterized protein (TIGR03435 family)
MTGLSGEFEIRLAWTRDDAPADQGSGGSGDAPSVSASIPMSSLYSALQEQLGLKLEPRRSLVEMLVIDHVEKVPTAN